MPPVKNETTGAAGGGGVKKWTTSTEDGSTETEGIAMPKQQDAHVEHEFAWWPPP